MSRRIVVIAGGPAAVAAAMAAKRTEASAQVTLLNEETCEPYEKPPQPFCLEGQVRRMHQSPGQVVFNDTVSLSSWIW